MITHVRSAPVEAEPAASRNPGSDPVGSDRRPASGFGGRFAWALGWSLAGKALTTAASGWPILSLLALTSVTFVTAAALFGWAGVAAAAVVQLVFMLWLDSGLAFTLTSVAAYSLAGAVAWWTLRWVPGLERGFERFRTLRWFVLAGAVGAVASSAAISSFAHPGTVLDQIAVWSRSTVISVWVLGPPLILVGRHWLARWVAPIPEEPEPTLPSEVTLVQRTLAGVAERIVEDVRTTPLRAERTVGLGVAAVAVLAGAKLLLVDEWGPSIFWWNLLFLVPVVWVTQRLRIAGGLVLVGVSAVGLLGTDAVLAPPGRLPPTTALVEFGQLLVLWLMAALVGRGARREGELLVALAESHERIQQDLHRVIRALTGALEAKDEYTEGHIHRVNAYALETGRRLGLSPRELELLQIGSTLHDIGKIGIPESILQKPGPLDDEEWRVMRRHPEIGARILTGVEGLSEVAPIILHHQERWDGRLGGPFPGYPAGLKGEKIPLGARIIAVVDTFDAMTTDRPYRDALSLEEARQELQREKGRQFDPEVVDRFLEVLRESPWE